MICMSLSGLKNCKQQLYNWQRLLKRGTQRGKTFHQFKPIVDRKIELNRVPQKDKVSSICFLETLGGD